MHTFQPYPIDTLEFNPFTFIGNQGFVATAEADGKINTTTVNWGGMGIMFEKSVAFICIQDFKYTKELIDNSDCFSMTFFDPEKKQFKNAMKYLKAATGRTEDKIAAAGLTVNRNHDVPFIDEGNFVLILKKMAAIPVTPETITVPGVCDDYYNKGNTDTIYIAEIIEILAR